MLGFCSIKPATATPAQILGEGTKDGDWGQLSWLFCKAFSRLPGLGWVQPIEHNSRKAEGRSWGESVSFWLPSCWGLQGCGCFPPPQATASAGTQLSGFQELLSICPFRPAAGNCISLLLVQCASPINTLYSYPLECYTYVSCQNPPTT